MIIFTLVQVFENKVILPVMLSHYVDLSPLTILCALIVGEQLGGNMKNSLFLFVLDFSEAPLSTLLLACDKVGLRVE